MRDAGLRLPRAATTGDVLAAHGTAYPLAMRRLARGTDFAAFAPDEPGDTEAIAAWADSDDIRKTTNQRLRLPARIRAALNPRSLLTRHR